MSHSTGVNTKVTKGSKGHKELRPLRVLRETLVSFVLTPGYSPFRTATPRKNETACHHKLLRTLLHILIHVLLEPRATDCKKDQVGRSSVGDSLTAHRWDQDNVAGIDVLRR